MAQYLVTGGAGFVGSHLAEELMRRGARVHVLDDLSTGAIAKIRHLKQRSGFSYTIDSAAAPGLVAELVDDADVVFHLAAAVGVELIVESPFGRSRQTCIAPRCCSRGPLPGNKATTRRSDARRRSTGSIDSSAPPTDADALTTPMGAL
jgi:NAD(P)-dependent dehydrogenase (short-subunit alcohol dehydrogenase family)